MTRYSSPLTNLKVASPCSADWNEMYGNDRRRFCADCKLNVYNLSGMTRNEAEQLITNAEGRLCVRFYRRADGTVLTSDCPVGWAAVVKRAKTAAGAIGSLAVALITGVFSVSMLRRAPPDPVVGVLEAIPPVVRIQPEMGAVIYEPRSR